VHVFFAQGLASNWLDKGSGAFEKLNGMQTDGWDTVLVSYAKTKCYSGIVVGKNLLELKRACYAWILKYHWHPLKWLSFLY
jgi:hypothetical protein